MAHPDVEARALSMLAEGKTALAVAAELGKGRRTIARWQAQARARAALVPALPPSPPPMQTPPVVAAAPPSEPARQKPPPKLEPPPKAPEVTPDLETTLSNLLEHAKRTLSTPGITPGAVRTVTTSILDLEKRQRVRELQDKPPEERLDFDSFTDEEMETFRRLLDKARGR